MTASRSSAVVADVSVPLAAVAIVATGVALLLLASLHVLSREFDSSWRMVSEYVRGHYGWVLSMMFAFWGAGSWLLAFLQSGAFSSERLLLWLANLTWISVVLMFAALVVMTTEYFKAGG